MSLSSEEKQILARLLSIHAKYYNDPEHWDDISFLLDLCSDLKNEIIKLNAPTIGPRRRRSSDQPEEINQEQVL